MSPKHASSIPLVLNCNTLWISPQFHVIFDEWFSSVTATAIDITPPSWWQDLFIHHRFKFEFDPSTDPINLPDEWLEPDERLLRKFTQQQDRVLPPRMPGTPMPPPIGTPLPTSAAPTNPIQLHPQLASPNPLVNQRETRQAPLPPPVNPIQFAHQSQGKP